MKPETNKTGFTYKIVTREEALKAYFDGKDVYMVDTEYMTISKISGLCVDELQDDFGDVCYFVKEEK